VFPEPDLAILLDVEPEIGLRRKTGFKSRFPEYENIDFLVKVRENYMKLVRMGKLVLINANASIENVYREVFELFMKKYKAMVGEE
ncbi:MAG: dTMP kinase, partial [Desulfurococcaceae archaeon]